MDELSIIFVTMDRPHFAQRLIFSIRRRFGDVPIHVADQTAPTAFMRAFYARHGVDVLWMPHDSGVSACRNALVARSTKQLLLLCDDDFRICPDTELSGALSILNADAEVGILGGSLIDEDEGAEDSVRHFELFFHLDEKNRTLTAVPAYHFVQKPRFVGLHKYYPCDAVLNFAVFRRAVFDDPRVRWDPRFTCNGEHEDFFLNFKAVSPYRVAYYPGLRARHHGDHGSIPSYERLRRRSEGWRSFLEKWGIEQYCELDNGTRTASAPGKLQKRSWSAFLADVDPSGAFEYAVRTHRISLTEEGQVILARHYDPETGEVLRPPETPGKLALDGADRLQVTAPDVTGRAADPDASTETLAKLVRARSNVRLRFHAPSEILEGGQAWIVVQVHNDGDETLGIGPDAATKGSFSCRWRRGGSYVAFKEGTTGCYADLSPGVHEQAVLLHAPLTTGSFELEVALVVGDALILGEPASTRMTVRPHVDGASEQAPLALLAAGGQIAPTAPGADGDARLSWLREHVRIRPLQGDGAASDSHLAVEIDCTATYGDAGIPDLTLTHHWKRGGAYVAWDVRRQLVSGLKQGRQIRTIAVERPVDPAVSLEIAALVPMAGYVRLFSENETERMTGE